MLWSGLLRCPKPFPQAGVDHPAGIRFLFLFRSISQLLNTDVFWHLSPQASSLRHKDSAFPQHPWGRESCCIFPCVCWAQAAAIAVLFSLQIQSSPSIPGVSPGARGCRWLSPSSNSWLLHSSSSQGWCCWPRVGVTAWLREGARCVPHHGFYQSQVTSVVPTQLAGPFFVHVPDVN